MLEFVRKFCLLIDCAGYQLGSKSIVIFLMRFLN